MAKANRYRPTIFVWVGLLLTAPLSAQPDGTLPAIGDPYRVPETISLSDQGVESNIDPFLQSRRRERIGIPVSLKGLWMTDSQTGLSSSNVSLKLPILKLFGTPPPIVKTGFGYTDLFAATDLGLPNNLYEYSIGVSVVKPINDRWVIRSILAAGRSV